MSTLIANAVENALGGDQAAVREAPLSPEKVRGLLAGASPAAR